MIRSAIAAAVATLMVHAAAPWVAVVLVAGPMLVVAAAVGLTVLARVS
jgi:hypothetical protein